MTVKELINELLKYDHVERVFLNDKDGFVKLKSINLYSSGLKNSGIIVLSAQ